MSHVILNLSYVMSNYFLPPNTTCGRQPLDAWIIKDFKLKYRQSLLNNFIASSETSGSILDYIKMITLMHSTNWIYSAWNNIESSVIQNCFKHVGINIHPRQYVWSHPWYLEEMVTVDWDSSQIFDTVPLVVASTVGTLVV